MNTDRTSATVFITKEIHMALAQPSRFFMWWCRRRPWWAGSRTGNRHR